MVKLDATQCRNLSFATKREWLLTNGIGGFAMGTVAGINSRRYHGHLIAATRPVTDRVNLVGSIEATAIVDGVAHALSSNRYPGTIYPDGYQNLVQFSYGSDVVWRFRCGATTISKSLRLVEGRNECVIDYRNDGEVACLLTVRPLTLCRSYHGDFHEQHYPETIRFEDDRTLLIHEGIDLEILHDGAVAEPFGKWYYRFVYERESERGLPDQEDMFCPVTLTYALEPGETASIRCSHGESTFVTRHFAATAGLTLKDRLIDSARRLLVTNGKRTTILAGYPWFTDWGRDTMISLPGAMAATGRAEIGREVLTSYANLLVDGLIPNRVVEGDERADYNTVDATLWFVHAGKACLKLADDEPFARTMTDAFIKIYEAHVGGSLPEIAMDPFDGLLRQGSQNTPLTWMDAKVDGRPITPRDGKPVEINGLWIDALATGLGWLRRFAADDALVARVEASLELAKTAFKERYWNSETGCLYDVLDPMDPSIRPNQVIALSLEGVDFDQDKAKSALEVVGRELLTGFGLRTLAPSDPKYIGRFEGSMPQRDAAYHQGTVWPWLLGPYLTALVRWTGDRAQARSIVKSLKPLTEEYGLGGIAEVYDGDAPHRPGGCPWQAWSICEILRAMTQEL